MNRVYDDPALEWHRKQKEKDDRIEQLEELCCDMYYVIFDRTYEEVSTPEHSDFMKRMDALGLLGGEQNESM